MRNHRLLAAVLLVGTACPSKEPAVTEPARAAADARTAAASATAPDASGAGPKAAASTAPAGAAAREPGERKPRLPGGMASAEASPASAERPDARAGKATAGKASETASKTATVAAATTKAPAASKTAADTSAKAPAASKTATALAPATAKDPAAAPGPAAETPSAGPATAERRDDREPDAGARAAEATPGGKIIPAELMAESAQPRPVAGGPDGGRRPREQSETAVASAAGTGVPSPDERPAGRTRPSSAPDPEGGGGGLPIPGAEITFQASRVRRFLDSGGISLDGRVVDADTGKVVDAADIEAWMGTRSVEAETDPQGRFRFEGLVPGSRLMLWITAAPTYVQERTEVVVPPNQTSFQGTFKLLNRSALTGAFDGGAGLFLSRRGSRTVVTGLAAFGPAERAGVRVGDAIVAVGKRKVGELGPGAVDYLLRGTIGSELELTVQTGSEPPRKLQMRRAAR